MKVIMIPWPNQLFLAALRQLQEWQKKQFAVVMVLVIMTPYVMPVFVNSYSKSYHTFFEAILSSWGFRYSEAVAAYYKMMMWFRNLYAHAGVT